MSGFVAVNLIDFEKLTPAQKKQLKDKLQSRVRTLQEQLDEVTKALKLVEGRMPRPKK